MTGYRAPSPLSPEWAEGAACATPEVRPEWWDTDVASRSQLLLAEEICLNCPVFTACAEARPSKRNGGLYGGVGMVWAAEVAVDLPGGEPRWQPVSRVVQHVLSGRARGRAYGDTMRRKRGAA